MPYDEEKEFVLRLEFRCAFADDYDGELDGFEWAHEVPEIAADMVHQVVASLQKRPHWQIRTANRGRPSDEEVTLIAERTF